MYEYQSPPCTTYGIYNDFGAPFTTIALTIHKIYTLRVRYCYVNLVTTYNMYKSKCQIYIHPIPKDLRKDAVYTFLLHIVR